MDMENCERVYDQIKKRWMLLHDNCAANSFFVGFEIIDKEIIVIWARDHWNLQFYRNLDHIKFYECHIDKDNEKEIRKEFKLWNKSFKEEGKGGTKHVIEKKLNTNYAGQYVKLKQDSSIS